MLNNPRVTFVVTSFNYENYIEKTLESIKNQTYDNFEIIVVDDCSSDNSVKIIREFISKNPDLKIKLIIHNENKGQLGAYLTGLEAAEGVFVSFIDSDDYLETADFYEKLYNKAIQTNADITKGLYKNSFDNTVYENINNKDVVLRLSYDEYHTKKLSSKTIYNIIDPYDERLIPVKK